ncbi:AraC family transcriptional regulator [Saccharibacillus kuerlensis]|uniref:HTH araC/xylS-type domain-containing protein n=1 Tax=Saccharibacillus kuerlensis TaxID=459527 RepID=A0ABQ2L5E6_9BACL|nr:AraC family transcriptional regulator [Saccharibacillus kuerlensis]GGO01665.1 hypothetical protein GCM10010969_24240 [Saccharibacillus kuerlensis]
MNHEKKPFYIDYAFENGLSMHLESVDVLEKYPKHAHSFCEIIYVLHGNGELILNEGTLPVCGGDLFFIPAGEEHCFQAADTHDSNLRLINCIFEQNLLKSTGSDHPLFGELEELSRLFLGLDRCLSVRDQSYELGRVLHALELNLRHKPTGYRYKLFIILIDLLERIRRAAHLSDDPLQPAYSGSPAADPVRWTIDHLTACYKSPLSFEELAAQALISPRHLQRKFKAETGLTFIRMLQEIRIRQSCELLQSTNWSIQEVAREVGIEDMKYFYRLFREKCGMTPSEFRSGKEQH